MDFVSLAVAAIGLFVAGIIKGVTGLGYSSCALPFLTMAVGPKSAIALVILPALATNFSLALGSGHLKETLTEYKWLYLTMLPGIALGLWLLVIIDGASVIKLLGATISSYALIALVKPRLTLPSHLHTPLQFPTGFLNGVVAGMTGAQVMPLFPYVLSLHLDPARSVQLINVSVLIASTVLAFGLIATGILTGPLAVTSVAALVPALIGVECGSRMRSLISAESFRRVALITFLMLGILMLFR